MSKVQERRLQALEAVQLAAGQQPEPAYICVQSAAEIPVALAAKGRRVRVYMGVCPDDWGQEHEADSAPIAGA